MDDLGVGRLLVASLHQGIAEELPFRLEFYEGWLHPKGLRDGRIGLAQMTAVLSFLRQEGDDAYGRVTSRAGSCSAEWLVDGLSPISRRVAALLPRWLRHRYVLRLAKHLVRQSYGGSRAIIRNGRLGHGTLDVRGSLFCQTRHKVPAPLCHYYASAVATLCRRFDLPLGAEAIACRAVGAPHCLIVSHVADGTSE